MFLILGKLALLLALGLQCFPLRACALREIVVGDSCHVESQSSSESISTPDGHASQTPCESGDGCLCDRPAPQVSRQQDSADEFALSFDLLASTPSNLIVFEPAGCLVVDARHPPADSPPARSFPLLI